MGEPGEHLPGVITSITPQKKNKERYSIFVDDEYVIGVDGTTLLNHKLKKGVEMTPSLFRTLQRDEGRHAVKSYMLKLLSRRAHARRELFDKARKKDYPEDTVQDVLDELEQKNFIDDASFAKSFARDKSLLNSWGPAKIKAHLTKKGIAKEVSEKAIAQAFEPIDLRQHFHGLIKKRRRHFLREEDPFKRKKKVVNYLRSKGYLPGSIYKYLDELMKNLTTKNTDS